jgi:hypothetical protein
MRVGRPRRLGAPSFQSLHETRGRSTDPRARMCGTCSCRADQDADRYGQPRVWAFFSSFTRRSFGAGSPPLVDLLGHRDQARSPSSGPTANSR